MATEFTWTVAQDSLGYIWVNHVAALSRYDGYNFKIYTHGPTDSLQKALDIYLSQPIKDLHGNIWYDEKVNESKTLIRHNRKTDGFEKIILDFEGQAPPRCIFEEEGGLLWIGTGGNGSLSLGPNGFPQNSPTSTVVGDPNPEWRSGLGTRLTWKNLSLNVLFEHSHGGQLQAGTRSAMIAFGTHTDMREERIA